jgi:hypothetical protein
MHQWGTQKRIMGIDPPLKGRNVWKEYGLMSSHQTKNAFFFYYDILLQNFLVGCLLYTYSWVSYTLITHSLIFLSLSTIYDRLLLRRKERWRRGVKRETKNNKTCWYLDWLKRDEGKREEEYITMMNMSHEKKTEWHI